MRLLISTLVLLFCCAGQTAQAQYAEFPNALYARFHVNDFGLLSGNDLKLGEGFELAYIRNIAPYLNVGIPFKLDLSQLPNTTEAGIRHERSVTGSLDLLFQVMNMKAESKIIPYAFVGGGYFLEEFRDGHFQAPVGLGFNFRLSKYAFFNVQGEFRKAFTDNRDNLHFGAGFSYLLHKGAPPVVLPPDADGDGTPDKLDQCPDQVGPTTAKGCPDRDSDGIGDKEDNCSDDAGPAETKGCPDYDNDGVADRDDQCPTEPGTVKGCPDTDGDQVVDKEDR
ncbi:MAG TPA: thrombospondin type 3 repeat-containing protein, partial [Saprospiraceae bacterium]|nr:thrombospondin type 3 repeat-containing protein [Saprospiraceae bacterium]